MDTVYLLLKFVHVAAIIVWVGGIFALSLLNAHAAGSGNAPAQAEMGRLSEYFGRVAIGPAMIVAVLAGIATAWRIGFPFSSLWIVWGLIGFVLSGALIGFIGRTARDFSALSAGAGQLVNACTLLLCAPASSYHVYRDSRGFVSSWYIGIPVRTMRHVQP